MKKRDLLVAIRRIARAHEVPCEYVGGTKHEKYRVNGAMIVIPRHTEIAEMLPRSILAQCEAAASTAAKEGE